MIGNHRRQPLYTVASILNLGSNSQLYLRDNAGAELSAKLVKTKGRSYVLSHTSNYLVVWMIVLAKHSW